MSTSPNEALPDGTHHQWGWETYDFHIPHQISWALTFRQDRFTWVQFLALAAKNDPCLWEQNVATRRVLCLLCRVSPPAFGDALLRAKRTAYSTYRAVVVNGERIRADRPKAGRGWSLPRPWGAPVEDPEWGTGYNWHGAVHGVWKATLAGGRLDNVLATVTPAAALPHMAQSMDVAEMVNRYPVHDRREGRHTKGGTPGTPDDDESNDWQRREYVRTEGQP